VKAKGAGEQDARGSGCWKAAKRGCGAARAACGVQGIAGAAALVSSFNARSGKKPVVFFYHFVVHKFEKPAGRRWRGPSLPRDVNFMPQLSDAAQAPRSKIK
jgi:hypothetical protein